MGTSHIKSLLQSVLSIIIVSFLSGCTSFGPTKPNLVYQGPYPGKYYELAQKNPLLAQELGKLPEIQDGISSNEAVALEKLAKLYNKDQAAFDIAFAKMYQVGIPAVRKYCSALQALFWLLEKKQYENTKILSLSLYELLNEAWYKPVFEYGEPERWKSFSVVADRLNSPFLIDFYERRSFSYGPHPSYELHAGGPLPQAIFQSKIGTCSFFTSFTVYCLKRAGYYAKPITVMLSDGELHRVCEFKDKDGETYIMDNSRKVTPAGTGITTRKTYLEGIEFVSYGYFRW
jgi:hypothetical protein